MNAAKLTIEDISQENKLRLVFKEIAHIVRIHGENEVNGKLVDAIDSYLEGVNIFFEFSWRCNKFWNSRNNELSIVIHQFDNFIGMIDIARADFCQKVNWKKEGF